MSSKMILAVLNTLPEARPLFDAARLRAAELAGEKSLVTLFKTIISTNQELFSTTTKPERLLFAFHAHIIADQFKGSDEYNAVIEYIKSITIPGSYAGEFETALHKALYEHAMGATRNSYWQIFPLIEEALGEKSERGIDLPSLELPEGAKIPTDLSPYTRVMCV